MGEAVGKSGSVRRKPPRGASMGTSVRIFTVQGTKFTPISYARWKRVWDGEERLPEYAGQRVKYALVFVDTEDRKPVGIKYVEWAYRRIEKDGSFDALAAVKEAVDGMSLHAPSQAAGSTVLDGRTAFVKRRNFWEPTAELRNAIYRAALQRR